MTRPRSRALAALVLVVGAAFSLGLAGSVYAGRTADAQPSRLAAAAERVTITARPTVVAFQGWTELFGSVEGAKEGDGVAIQAKDCGRDFFRVVGGTTVMEGGSWSWRHYPRVSTALRAVWNDIASRHVTIRRRALVGLDRRSGGRFEVRVAAGTAWRKRAFIQRFDRSLGTWHALRSVVLTNNTYGGFPSAVFTVSVPKRTRLRAVFPRSQAGPCYLTGTSRTLIT
jgi:hypothetical protein